MTTGAPAPEDPRLLKLRAGEPLEFPAPPADKEQTPEETTARTIPAKWLEDLAAKHARVVDVPIAISNAVIAGPLNLRYVTFEAELSITGCRFTDEADFSFASFKRSATFQGSRFKKAANFRAAHAHGDFRIARAFFANDTNFQDLHVDEVLQASGARFGSVNFQRIEVSKSAFFRTDAKGQRTTFGGEARFHSAHIKGGAEFNGAKFKGTAAFDGLQVDGGAFFRTDAKGQRTTFGGEARFHGAHIKGGADFRGAEFTGEASFDGLQVDGDAFFRTDAKAQRTTFGGQARFLGAHIQGNAEFNGAEFQDSAAFDNLQVDGSAFFRTCAKAQRTTFGGQARFHGAHIHGQASFLGAHFKAKARFDRIHVDGNALFRSDDEHNRVMFGGPAHFPSAIFGAGAQFIAAEFKADAHFDNAHFHGAADFTSAHFGEVKKGDQAKAEKATFVGARFDRGAYFNSVQFRGETDFTAAVAERDAYFHGATFSKDASFREARYAVVHFEAPDRKASDPSLSTTFVGGVDLRGFRYDRMGVAWRSLLDKLTPYDRQPYAQLEKAFREAGEDRKADEVYLQRRRVERKDKWNRQQYGSWFGDAVYGVLANYGVRPYRLLLFTALVLGFGLIIFTYPHAVTHKDLRLRADDPLSLGWRQATAVSVNLFLPVEVAAGSQWVPTENRIPLFGRLAISFATYASVHRLAGWLLVPLGVAALTGLLHKRGKPDRG